jgi:hypothetical protein
MYTVMVPQPRTVVKTFTVCKPVQYEVEQAYTEMVPYTEVRQGVRKICQRVPVETTRTVCRDMGHWEDRTIEVCRVGGCGVGGCAPVCVSPTLPVMLRFRPMVKAPSTLRAELAMTTSLVALPNAPGAPCGIVPRRRIPIDLQSLSSD